MKLVAITIFLSIFSEVLLGSHIVGANITYTNVGPGAVFKVTLYRDCAGIGATTDAQICFSSASGCAPSFTEMLPMDITTSGIQVPLNACNGTGFNTCNGGGIYMFEEYNYIGYVNAPPCSDWIVSFDACCRNVAVTNLMNLNFTSLIVETKFDNLNYPINSSPQFNSMPVNYFCLGVPSLINFSAYDPDGDSLTYEFIEVLDGSCGASFPSPLLFPFTFDQPLATFAPAILDPFGGQILFTPSAIQNSVVGVKINEYRNGVLIGSVRRDDEIVVTGTIVNADTIAGRVYYDLNLNAIFDAGDIPAPNIMVELGPGTNYAISALSGKYDFQVPAGMYTISITNVPTYMNLVSLPYTVTASGSGTFSGNHDFALQPVQNINDLKISINNSGNPVPGQTYPVYVNYENAGTTVQFNPAITVFLDPALAFISSVPAPSSSVGNAFTWNLPPLGLFANGIISLHTTVDTSAQAGAPVFCSATISSPLSDQTLFNNSDSFSDVVSVSLDPNHKEVTPSGDLPLSFITNQQWLNYTINFQNTGSAPTQIIRILDLLDFDLDFNSLELVSSSYPCAMILQNTNELEFNFYGINLTTAIQNEASSHGFVEYRIKPKASVPVGSFITNEASIVFDFNPPVHTNLVHNKIVLSTGIAAITNPESTMKIFPNPASDFVTLQVTNTSSEIASIRINNLIGELVFENNILLKPGSNELQVPVNEWLSGMYFISVRKLSGTATMKILLQ